MYEIKTHRKMRGQDIEDEKDKNTGIRKMHERRRNALRDEKHRNYNKEGT